MFTGIIKEVGIVRNILKKPGKTEVEIYCSICSEEIKEGSSIAIDGACLTVTEKGKSSFKVDIVEETLKKTTFSKIKINDRVNIELPLKLSERFDGHIVQGHIDGTGKILKKKNLEGSTLITIKLSEEMIPYIVEKGSICIDGISLTIANIEKEDITVSLIPYTLQNTSIGTKKVGDSVNIELDIIGKYVNKVLTSQKEKINKNFLKETGFL
ncbi:riboflavin synthase [candidate division KSB1 bacterium]|nr:MAG: riboflavin synthase [candidate division KSB1 bacterium]